MGVNYLTLPYLNETFVDFACGASLPRLSQSHLRPWSDIWLLNTCYIYNFILPTALQHTITKMIFKRLPVGTVLPRYVEGKYFSRSPYGTVSDTSAPEPTPPTGVFQQAQMAKGPRHNWSKEEIKEIYQTPLMKLTYAAVSNTIAHHNRGNPSDSY